METVQESWLQLKRQTLINGRCVVGGRVQSIDATDASTRRANRKESDM